MPFEALEERHFLASDLIIVGVIDGPLSGGTPKAIELYARSDIPDLSRYAVGSANNGGGSDGVEFIFPPDAVSAGTFLRVASESPNFRSFFGFEPEYVGGSAVTVNGDDAVELFFDGIGDGFSDPLAPDDVVSDVFGDIHVDGSGTAWEYLDGWAYRVNATGPDGSTFAIGNWRFSGVNALDGESANATATTPFPSQNYADTSGPEIDVRGGSPAISIANNDGSPSMADGTDFGLAATGTTAITHTFTIANVGTLDLGLTGNPLVSLTGSADFAIRSQPAADVVAAGNSISFDLTFAPSTRGAQTAWVSIASDDADENPFTFAIQGTGITIATNVGINEVDADTADENHEFIELYDGGVGNVALDGLVVVLFNGSDNRSYNAIDLDGFATDSDGFFVIGDGDTPNVGFTPAGFDEPGTASPGSDLQNGEDAVALYVGSDTDFPNDTPASAANRLDAVVYETGADGDSTLPTDLGTDAVIDENANGNKDVESISRSPDLTGAFLALAPTPGAKNTVVPLPELSLDDRSGDEGVGTMTFIVKLSQPSANSVTVFAETVDGTAHSPSDYGAISAMPIVFAPGQTEKTIDVSIVDDAQIEGDESFTVRLFDAAGATIIDPEALGTIIDDEVLPSLSVADVVVEESAAAADFIVSLSPAVDFEVSVDVATADGSATSALDFTAIDSSTLTFAAGETVKTISVPIVDDPTTEADETFQLVLSNPRGATLADDEGVATILANDFPIYHPGDIVINEIMQNPSAVNDAVGEFFELWNTTSSGIDINGWTIRDEATDSESHTILTERPLVVPADGFLLLGVNGDSTANGGVHVDYVYDSVALGNGSDGLILEDAAGTLIDQVTWDDGVTFPDPNGASMELIPGTSSPGTANDLGSNWQVSSHALASGDLATPGAVNSTPVPPEVSINDVTVEESAGEAKFTLSLSKAASTDVRVDVTTLDGTAMAPDDYSPIAIRVTFAAGEVTKEISVRIIDDAIPEADETFTVELSNPRGATIVDGQGVATILANDEPVFRPGDVVINEIMRNPAAVADGAGEFIELWNTTAATIDIHGWTISDEATASESHTVDAGGSLSIPAGGFLVLGINGDSASNGGIPVDYVYSGVTLGNGADGLILADPSGAVMDEVIWDDGTTFPSPDGASMELTPNTSSPHSANDLGSNWQASTHTLSSGDKATPGAVNSLPIPPELAIDDVTVDESAGLAQFTITLSKQAKSMVTVDAWTSDGDASAGEDYAGFLENLTFTAGETSKIFSVPIIDDAILETVETFFASLHNPSGATIADDLGIGTIIDNEVPSLSIDDVTVTESAGEAIFTVTLSDAVGFDVSVSVATSDGSASAPSDFTAIPPTTVTFDPGETSQTIAVPIIDDATPEGDELFRVELSQPTRATLDDDLGEGIILANDAPSFRAGDVVISEIMQNPAAVSDAMGEFVELWNTTSKAVDLNGWTIKDEGSASESHTIDAGGPLWIPAGGFLLLGINGDTATNGAIRLDYVYSRLTLGNGVDGLILVDASGTVIDQVIWDDGQSFPDPNGASMELIPGIAAPAVANDLGSNWRASTNPLPSGDHATPGEVNSTPPTAEISIDDVTLAESAGVAVFTVTLSEAASSQVWVTAATVEGSATADDYAELTSTLTFDPGETSKTVRFWIIDDSIPEGDETFTLQLSNPRGATLADDQGTGTILANDNMAFETGDVVINEIMQNPAAVNDGQGEFVELWNTTSSPIDINGWTLKDDASASESHTIGHDGPLSIPAGGYLVLGLSGDTTINGGVPVDYVYGGVTLGNGSDGLLLEDASGKVIDQVIWDDGMTFPDPNGASMELIPGTPNPGTANDLGSNWQVSTHALATGDRATPGAVNSQPIEEDACNPSSGDLDGDGVIGFGDFLLMSSHFGNTEASAEIGDLNCDGVIDFSDFLILSANFGQAMPLAAEAVDQVFAHFD